MRRVFAHYAAQRGKSRYGDKMPAYVLRIPALAEMFPEGRFVHIIRDGRDVALSAMAIAGQRHDPVALAIDWRRRVEAGREAGRHGSAPGVTTSCATSTSWPTRPGRSPSCARSSTSTTSRGCCSSSNVRDNVPAKVRANPRHARLAEPLSSGVRSWRTDMQPADVDRFEAVAGELLGELGYERGVAAPSVRARAAASWGRVRWSVHRGGVRLPGRGAPGRRARRRRPRP